MTSCQYIFEYFDHNCNENFLTIRSPGYGRLRTPSFQEVEKIGPVEVPNADQEDQQPEDVRCRDGGVSERGL